MALQHFIEEVTKSCHVEDLSTQNSTVFTNCYGTFWSCILHRWITHILAALAVTAGSIYWGKKTKQSKKFLIWVFIFWKHRRAKKHLAR